MNDAIRRSMALFSIGTVMKLTDLTARQIRYYEQHQLIVPARTSGNQGLFSFNDVERLLEIKNLIDKGVNIAGIKQVMNPISKAEPVSNADTPLKKPKNITDSDLLKKLKQELVQNAGKPGRVSMIQGQLSRYFKI